MSEHLCPHCGKPIREAATANDALINDHDFITDCARYAEGILTEAAVKKKYRFDDASWESLGEDDALVEAIEAEKVRRIRNGATARERAQRLFTEAPNVLGTIMKNDDASPRHRIEAAREIRQVAANGPENAQTADRFIITINLGEDAKLRSAQPDPNDVIVIDATPRKTPAAITDKSKDDWKR